MTNRDGRHMGSLMVWTAVLLIGCGTREAAAPGGGAATSEGAAPAGEGAVGEGTASEGAVAVENAAIPADAQRIGEAITVVTAPITLADMRANPADYFEKTLLVEGTAAAVCQAKGCWMTITDGVGEPIWVRWSSGCGGAYAFPKEAAGKHVILQGSFYAKEISPADAEHLAGESGTLKADEIAGSTYEINATACVVMPAATEAASEPAAQPS